MSTRPVNFANGTSKMILSVIKKGATTGTSNYNQDILYQRYEYGSLAATSTLTTRGAGSFGTAPEYHGGQLRQQHQPADHQPADRTWSAPNGYVYVTEIYTTHTLITPFDRSGSRCRASSTRLRTSDIASWTSDMTKQRRKLSGEEGFALVYMAAALTTFLLFTGLALDSGRAYVVKAQLTKAVDGAALGAARNLNSGNPRARGRAHLQGQFSDRILRHHVGDRPDQRSGVLQLHRRSPRPASTSSPSRRRRCCRRRSCGWPTSTR